jgi:hypothetical protein
LPFPLALRDHPLMSYRGVRNWPPQWTWVGGGQPDRNPQGEVGVLRSVRFSQAHPPARCFLYMEHEGGSYMSCLLFEDLNFCQQIANLLDGCHNRSIAEIGGLDVSHTL